MKVIIAGSRNFNDYELLCKSIEETKLDITEVFCGCAQGADNLGERWALEKEKHIIYFPASWEKHGKSAGPIRNHEMSLNADALIVFWDDKSSGTKNMIYHMQDKPTYIFHF